MPPAAANPRLKPWRRYDPELPERQRHRDFLRERVVFREVVPISDAAVRAKIHQTYRMGYLKDVILPRYLIVWHTSLVSCSGQAAVTAQGST